MKKYVKPELFFENFELSQQIAACDYDSKGTMNDEGCVFTSDGGSLMVFMSACGGTDPVTGNEIWRVENYCYHNAASSPYGIFNS